MGYFSINKCEITRVCGPDRHGPDRHILVRCYCDELQKWHEQKFQFNDWYGALRWCEMQMTQLSM